MRRNPRLILLPLMSLTLGACGSDKAASTTSTTTAATTGTTATTSTTTTALTPQQLSGALLAASDLGDGWTETQRDVFTTRQPENPSIDPSLWCPDGLGDQLVTLAGQEGADVELTRGSTQPSYIVRQQAWTNPNVEQYFNSVTSALTACSGVTWKDSEGNSYSLEPLTAPKIGDESISWTVTIQLVDPTPKTLPAQAPGDRCCRARLTVARFGTVMMVLQGGATPTTGPSATAPNYLMIVRIAADKMAALVAP